MGVTRVVAFDIVEALVGEMATNTKGLVQWIWMAHYKGKKGKLGIQMVYSPHNITNPKANDKVYNK